MTSRLRATETVMVTSRRMRARSLCSSTSYTSSLVMTEPHECKGTPF